jgi:hypothetical protein
MRTSMRRAAAIFEPRLARLPSALDPLVSGRSRDSVALAELGSSTTARFEIANKPIPLFQDTRFHPRHLRGVNDVPGFLLRINPDRTGELITGR